MDHRRWLDVNKGDSDKLDVRSRYVGKEFAGCVDATLNAGPPPLVDLKFTIGAEWVAYHGQRLQGCIMPCGSKA